MILTSGANVSRCLNTDINIVNKIRSFAQIRLNANVADWITLSGVWIRLVNKCMSKHLNANANVSLESNANTFLEISFSKNSFKCKCFGVAFKCKCKCFRYTFANAFEFI